MIQEVGDRVFVRHYESLDQNIGIVVSETGVLVVDTRSSHLEADELIRDVARLTPLPIRWVVDTHWHWDHVLGNSRFGRAEIWGHRLCAEVLREMPDATREAAVAWFPERRGEFEETLVVPPDHVFDERVTLDMGSRTVDLEYHGRGHTDADVVVRVPGEDLVFMGDLLESGAPPYFEDGYPLSWPATVRSAVGRGDLLAIPGHGGLMTRDRVDAQLADLEAVAALARACIRGEVGVDDATRSGPYSPDQMEPILRRALVVGL